MADKPGAWGIEIGQAGLKAVRLKYDEASFQATAVAFDYIPHPKILSQPDANPEELVQQALEIFLSRNNVEKDYVNISVPGQTALARFIQLPPVESSKVPEIVKYEARQQIPFALEDVIWDYQTLGSGTEEGGFMLNAEVGLFAMKRDQVMQHLAPFVDAMVEVEAIQIVPLALYNFLCFDQLEIGKDDPVDPDAEHTIVLDMGADNTTLLVSNGEKIWLRNVPIGGNHFTRALTKGLKLTFAKAEHLKLNATKSPDPRSVFQALRPVFNDYVAEIQRSIGYFSSINKDAKIDRIIGVGNGFKLAGLQKFLQQNLQYQVDRVHSFDALAGDAVLRAPLFQDNIMSFAVPYGLALQSLGITRISTSLLPPEIVIERLVRKKKPWAVAAAASLLIGLSTSALGFNHVMESVSPAIWDNKEGKGGSAEQRADEVKKKADDFKSRYAAVISENDRLKTFGNTLVGTYEDRVYWPEVYKAINECLPRNVDDSVIDVEDPSTIERIQVEQINVTYLGDTAKWFNLLGITDKEMMRPDDQKTAPTGDGYLFTLSCVHHYEDKEDDAFRSRLWIRDTIMKNLNEWTVQQGDSPESVPVRKIGITHPALVSFDFGRVNFEIDGTPTGSRPPKANRARSGFNRRSGRNKDEKKTGGRHGLRGSRALGVNRDGGRPTVLKIPKTEFVIQFLWKQTPFKDRAETDPTLEKSSSPNQENAAETSDSHDAK